VQAAEFLLEHMARTLWDPVDPTKLGSLDSTLHARVNGEIYRCASTATRDRFQRDPVRWCGILRDPVSGVRFVPDRRSPRWEHGGGPYFFAAESTWRAFRADPGRYAIHRDY
jgi:YHS domain-containing protein